MNTFLPSISIFTPSYNRAYILSELYKSLLAQTDKDFDWIIVDDGSSDNTEELVRGWMDEKLLDIKYIKQENQGKHIAINTGVRASSADLFFIVDSDDRLTPEAVDHIRRFWADANPGADIAGIISYRMFPDGKLVGTPLPEGLRRCKLREVIAKYGSTGDKVVVYRTRLLAERPYPKFDGERFFGECYVFNQIDDAHDMLVLPERLYVFDYQPDGLSQDFRKLYRENPKGFALCLEQQLQYERGLKGRMRTIAHIFCLATRNHDLPRALRLCGLYSLPAWPLGLYLYYKIFIRRVSDVKPYTESSDK